MLANDENGVSEVSSQGSGAVNLLYPVKTSPEDYGNPPSSAFLAKIVFGTGLYNSSEEPATFFSKFGVE